YVPGWMSVPTRKVPSENATTGGGGGAVTVTVWTVVVVTTVVFVGPVTVFVAGFVFAAQIFVFETVTHLPLLSVIVWVRTAAVATPAAMSTTAPAAINAARVAPRRIGGSVDQIRQ